MRFIQGEQRLNGLRPEELLADLSPEATPARLVVGGDRKLREETEGRARQRRIPSSGIAVFDARRDKQPCCDSASTIRVIAEASHDHAHSLARPRRHRPRDRRQYKILIDPFLTGNPGGGHQGRQGPGRLHPRLARARRPRRRHHRHRQAHRRHGDLQLRNQPNGCRSKGVDQGPRPAARRRLQASLRPRQADARLSRLDAARRQPTAATRAASSSTLKDGKKIYDAADTGLFGDMRLIGEEGIDLALLPIGDNYTMGPDDAVRAVKLHAAEEGDSDPLQHLAADRPGRRRRGPSACGPKRRPRSLS